MRVLHWSTAALLLGPYLAVWAIGHIAGEADAVWLAILHRSFGIVILTVTLLRFGIRQRSTIPLLPAGMPWIQRLAAKLSAAGLYALLIVQPLLGMLGTMLHGDRATVFGSLLLPKVLPVNQPLARAVFVLHGWTGMALLGLIGLHVLAAMHHHFVRRDTVLVSMLAGARNFAAPGSAGDKYAPIGGGPS